MILQFANKQAAIEGSRKSAQCVSLASDRVLCRVLDRWKVMLDYRDISYLPHLALDGIYRPHILEQLCDSIKPGMIIAEAGACFGYLTLLCAELVGDSGRVYAFEPNARVFHIAKQTFEINGLKDRIVLYPDAAGAENGQAPLMRHKSKFADSTMSARGIRSQNGQEEPRMVDVHTMDSRFLDGKVPDFFIITTSGYEPQVFAGMSGILAAKRKIGMLMEFTARYYDEAKAFASQILDQGFVVRKINSDGSLERFTDPAQFIGGGSLDLLLGR